MTIEFMESWIEKISESNLVFNRHLAKVSPKINFGLIAKVQLKLTKKRLQLVLTGLSF